MPKQKCDVCDQRKGKRACPARGGASICPQCCAQNRVKVFACPPSCPFLGSEGSLRLAAARSGEFTPPPAATVDGFMGTLMSLELRARLVSAAEPTALAALDQFGRMVSETESDGALDSAIIEWLLFGARSADGARLVDQVVTKLPRPLTAEELDALEALHRSHYRLIRLEELPEEGPVKVKDLLDDQSLEILGPGMRTRFHPGQAVGCFVTPTAEGLNVMMGAWAIPEGSEEALLRRLGELRDESPLKDVGMPEFVTRISLLVPMLIFESLAAAQPAQDPLDSPPPFL